MGGLDLLGVALSPLVDQVDDELDGRVLLLEDDLAVDDDLGGLVLHLQGGPTAGVRGLPGPRLRMGGRFASFHTAIDDDVTS